MTRRLTAALLLLAISLLLPVAAFAQSPNTDTYFYTPGGGGVNGALGMCLNTSSPPRAVPCSNAGVAPAPVGLTPYPFNPTTATQATPITAASGNVAAAVATATLAAAAGKTTYICGFSISSTGSTAAAVVSPTIANTITGTLTFTYASVAGATLANQTVTVPFLPCIPANNTNTTIAVSMPSLGAGNTNATVNAWGFQL